MGYRNDYPEAVISSLHSTLPLLFDFSISLYFSDPTGLIEKQRESKFTTK
jgi:hypothetical protein